MRNSNYEEIPFEEENDDPSNVNLEAEFTSLLENQKSNEVTYSKMTVQELKSILSERNMPTSGRKAELIQRLLDE